MSLALQDHRALHLLQQEMSPYEQLYAEARALGATPVAAARSAGYDDPVATSTVLEKSDRVRAVRDIYIRDQNRRRQLTRDDIVDGLQQAASMATNASEMVAAYKELGKLIGAYEPETHVVKHEYSIEELQKQSDEELLELAGMGSTLDAEFEVMEADSDGSDGSTEAGSDD